MSAKVYRTRKEESDDEAFDDDKDTDSPPWVFDTLPEGAVAAQVRNVYDGDTFTLIDGRRVRFIGVDTPELKEKEPYAAEAKLYTKSLCNKKTVYLVMEGEQSEDHYGRLLRYIFIKRKDGKFLLVNGGLIAQGFAVYYQVGRDKLRFTDEFMAAQKHARNEDFGMWSFLDERIEVRRTRNGRCYHHPQCENAKYARFKITVSEALDEGLSCCRSCQSMVESTKIDKKPPMDDSLDIEDPTEATVTSAEKEVEDFPWIFDTLPENAEEVKVRNVYDGDTLTLIDTHRVRFVGVDTPELKEKEPYAEEAKKYTKDLCHKKNIIIASEPTGETEDHYGRYLRYIFVRRADGKFILVQGGLIARGFATFYQVGNVDPRYKAQMMAAQKYARDNDFGMWSVVDETEQVVATNRGRCFHKKDCKHAKWARKHLTVGEGLDAGMTGCRTCH